MVLVKYLKRKHGSSHASSQHFHKIFNQKVDLSLTSAKCFEWPKYNHKKLIILWPEVDIIGKTHQMCWQ